MKKIALGSLLVLLFTIPFGCTDMDDNAVPSNLKIKDFVWKGMNLYYLWQADVPDLADNRFANQAQLNTFLETYTDPVALFNHLRTDAVTDRFSVIYSDYTLLEGALSGNTVNNGVDYGLRFKSGNSGTVYGWVRYIIPNSDASTKDIHRGDIFYAVDGVPLYYNSASDNNLSILNPTTYTLNFADYAAGNITPTGESLSLTKTALSENPIFMNTVITQGSRKIGYLVYNGFYPNYDTQLNTAFGSFAAQNVTDLVLDLRYNSGGAITSATKLASMITGQFSGQLFAKEQWNAKAQAYFMDTNPGRLQNKFVSGLNSLRLNKVYILTTKGTASASELVINCLKPYINVVQIGDVTTGKNVGSITLYDSPSFAKKDVNPSHKYAMQPIVLKIVDKNGFGNYTTGIVPTTSLPENLNNLEVLGDTNEPLLQTALNQINTGGRMAPPNPGIINRDFVNSKSINPLGSEMYVELK